MAARCPICGWLVTDGHCPCGAAARRSPPALVPVGAKVLARAGRGPSMQCWDRGEVQGHLGALHRVGTSAGVYWCELEDILPDAPEREVLFTKGARVWALWVDSRWYPGTIVGVEGPLRRVLWDDRDSMWTEARNMVLLAATESAPRVGQRVLARRWDSSTDSGTVEEDDGGRYRVVFSDGEESWVPAGQVSALPLNPFMDPE